MATAERLLGYTDALSGHRLLLPRSRTSAEWAGAELQSVLTAAAHDSPAGAAQAGGVDRAGGAQAGDAQAGDAQAGGAQARATQFGLLLNQRNADSFPKWVDGLMATLRRLGFAAELESRCLSGCRSGPMRCGEGREEPQVPTDQVGLTFLYHAKLDHTVVDVVRQLSMPQQPGAPLVGGTADALVLAPSGSMLHWVNAVRTLAVELGNLRNPGSALGVRTGTLSALSNRNAGRGGVGRSGVGRSGTGRSGTGRNGTGRNGTGRNGTGRNGDAAGGRMAVLVREFSHARPSEARHPYDEATGRDVLLGSARWAHEVGWGLLPVLAYAQTASGVAQRRIQHEASRGIHFTDGGREAGKARTSSLQPPAFRLQPSAFRLQPSAFSLQPSAFSLQPSAFSLQPSAFSLQPSAFRLPPSAFSHQPSAFSLQPAALPIIEGAPLRLEV